MKITALCAILLLVMNVHAQNWQWGRTGRLYRTSGISSSGGDFIATDTAGNSYCTGVYTTDSILFGAYTLINTTNSMTGITGNNAFLVKYDKYGNVKWAVNLDAVNPTGIAIDKTGKPYVSGQYSNEFINIGGLTFTNDAANNACLFVQFDTSGNLLWGTDVWECPARPCTVQTDAEGNIYIAGSFLGPITGVGSITIYNTDVSGTTSDIFIAKFSAAGLPQWVKVRGGDGDNVINYMTVDVAGNVYITGVDSTLPLPFFGGYSFNGIGLGNFFISKYDTSGNVRWSEKVIGEGSYSANAIASDAQCNVYITGGFDSSTIQFGSIILHNPYPLGYEMFLAKYDSAGNARWALTPTPTGRSEGYSIAVSDSQQVWVSGGYYPAISFGSYTLEPAPSTATDPLFLVRFDTGGIIKYGISLLSGGDNNSSISTDKNGNVYITGVDDITQLQIGPDTINSHYEGDFFIGKLGFNSDTVIETKVYELATTDQVVLYPDPADQNITLLMPAMYDGATISLCNLSGQSVSTNVARNRQVTINVSTFPPGMYFCKITTNSQTITKKIIIEHR